MGIKLNVGISKKIGLPDYGSAGSQCNLELELDNAALDRPEEFHRRVREAYAACRSAVEDELRNHQAKSQQESKQTPQEQPTSTSNTSASNGRGSFGPSSKQREYIQRLAGQVKGFSNQKLENLCQRMYQKPFTALSGLEASNLIDTLREVKAGRLDLSAV